MLFADGPDVDEVHVSPPDGSIIESNTTTLTCKVDTQPDAHIVLYGTTGEVLKKHDFGTELSYTMHSVGCQHSGTYTCEASNPKTHITHVQAKSIQVKCEWIVKNIS